MDGDKLVRMANGIAAFFRAYPEEQAVAGIRDHLRAFWAPGMRASLAALDQAGQRGLDPLVCKALRAQTGTQGSAQTRAESPAERATAGPDAVGQLGSDAG